jgi:2-dehydropantoate 2-reductase
MILHRRCRRHRRLARAPAWHAPAATFPVLARGRTLAALQHDGLRLRTGSGDAQRIETHRVQATADPKSLGVQDLIVIAVKAPALREVVRQIAPLMGPDTLVLCAMNGVPWWFLQGFGGDLQGQQLQSVDPGGVIGKAIAPQHIVGSVVHASCAVAAPGLVRSMASATRSSWASLPASAARGCWPCRRC